MYAPPEGRRASLRWKRLLSATALTTALAVALTSNQLPPSAEPMAPVAFLAEEPANGIFDFEAAARIRAEQCLLNLTLRRGGQELKAVSRGGLNGTEDELHAAAVTEGWWDNNTPLTLAWDKDDAWTQAKFRELSARVDVWEQSLDIPSQTTPPGYTVTGFESIEDGDNPFDNTGLTAGLGAMYFRLESDIYYTDQTPVASKESVDVVNTIATARYSEDRREDYEPLQALKDMTFMHPMYADDARIFLQHGGFPTTAPEPGTVEFRLDVEALKARFASCTPHNPPDPHQVLRAEVVQASVEWQDELSGQKAQRAVIMDAESKASGHLRVASQAMGEALAQSLIASRLTDWQAHWLAQSPNSTMFYPTAAEFAQVKTNIARARERAQGRVFVAGRATLAAQIEAVRADKAKAEAYAVADAAGLPRGRGLMYGQQAVQVAKASAAAAQAVFKATETASHATRASASDSKTLMALAETQAHASKAEFRRKAAEEAEAQAKAAAEGAALQAKLAAENATKAKGAQAKAEAAEATAKQAAADAKAKRETAERERDTAAAARQRADAERAKANEAEARAVAQRQTAATALSAAEAARATASEKLATAIDAENKAAAAKDRALTAERNKDATMARANSLEAAAAAAAGTEAAAETRAAATEARAAATQAAGAATAARTAANEATGHAVNAREAATKADGAAARSRSAAKGAEAAAAVTTAQVAQARAATAEAIDASEAAAQNVKNAEQFAKAAASEAVRARQNASAARAEALLAHASAVKAAGHAVATAQAATAARDSAAQVIKPANEAIELGSPYAESDTSAGLAVLVGQGAKTAAEQQAALAQAKADQAKKAAAAAKALATQASADAKAAAEAAARAAEWAAAAAVSLAQTRASAAEAQKAAEAARKAETNTIEYNRQAQEDAALAAHAASTATSEAAAANAAASEAEKDAVGARDAATAAEGDAGQANTVASAAERDATRAETAASNAREDAVEADQAADRAEEELRKRIAEQRQKRISEATPDPSTGPDPDTGPDLTESEEEILLRLCGQECVDQYRAARALAGEDILDWVIANGGQILLDTIGWPDLKACFTKGDVEACLWTLFNVVTTLIPVGKIPAVTKAIVKIGTGVDDFFEKAAGAKRTLEKLKELIEKGKRDPNLPPCVSPQIARFAVFSSSGSTPDHCDFGDASGLKKEYLDYLRYQYGQEVTTGVDYNWLRMHDGSAQAADHSIIGIGRDIDKLAQYLDGWRGRGTHYDKRYGVNTKVAYDQSKGVLVIIEPHRIHAYHFPEAVFMDEKRYPPLPGS
ncbi:hypothetical protein [Streptomyces sp.]|uniref:hypothetical protein n=1 Tax=Streptomyces sp. TaxID=1931 RepID=UPI002810E940|nr:hypothetical protein [Streptomyces sp.]